MADRDAAIKLDPDNMSTYCSRGYANIYLGHFDAVRQQRRRKMRGAILRRHLELAAEQPRSRHGYAEGGG
jgi:hypothetical protein